MATRTLPERAESWAGHHPVRLRGLNATLLVARSWRRSIEVRVTGLAAEMTYYALLSLVPLLLALGSALGWLERVLGTQRVAELEDVLIQALGAVFSPQLTSDVMAPLVRGLLQQERAGLAFGSLVITLWLAGRVFRAAVRALDDAYGVARRRRLLTQSLLSYAFSLLAIVALTAVLAFVVVGPLLGGGRQLAELLGLGTAFEVAWSVGRWPLVLGITGAFLVLVYRVGPNVDNTWRQCVPGAALGVVGIVLVALGMRLYLEVSGPRVPQFADAEAAVALAAQVVGAGLAVVLWAWLTSIAVLLGGVLNAELVRARAESAAP